MLDQLRREPQNRNLTPVGTGILLVITAVVIYLCWTMVAPFVSVLTWALALALVLNPLRQRLRRRLSNWATALLLVCFVILVGALLTAFVSHRLVHEAAKAQESIRPFLQPSFWEHFLQSQPWLGIFWRWIEPRIDIAQIGQQISAAAASRVAPAVGRSAMMISRAAMSLFVLFFFVRDQEALVDAVRRLLPLTADEIDLAWNRVSSAMRASVYGRVLIGIVQGALGGVMFYALGLPAPLFWTVVMAVLSMLPVVGAFVVWVPAAGFLLLTGHWIQALILAVYGVGIIHTADNILYPVLIGPRMGLHPLLLFIAFIGGLIAFGAAGLILGPAIVAFALALSEIWIRRQTLAPEIAT
ncbi:MAG TPA: AI-2E family transporter [Thermoanaerobaculia bacterium]|nr:AI-2E family transporter [Thermoanaerobaculia bacterium]